MSIRPVVVSMLAATALFAGSVQAATRYVSDELSINLRRGPGNEYRITELVEAGTRVEVLERAADGWSKVRTAGGEEGYVLTRFLSDSPAARDQLAAMKKRVAALEETNAELKKELAQALDGSEELGKLKKELVAENETLRKELAEIREASSNAIRISKENQEFRERLLALQSELEQLRHENKALQSRREGMKIGALVLAGGILIGLLLPLFRGRRRSSWDSL
ncbi:hypothetical protein PC39_03802 [Salinisphaera sp. PC39]|uniref:TIGR04211 family SH3 domain-containing protein n=1 Tax=Salinisphaera sp. PC39 TaxID=1304156 RepID=UPI00333E21C3